MNYNICAYGIFLLLMIFIIVYVGKYFFTNGRIFIISLFHGNTIIADQINRLLLIGYYLLNIGYSFIKLKQWEKIMDVEMMVSSLASQIGLLIFLLAIIHYCNMLVIYLLSKSKQFFLPDKSFQL